MESRQTGTAGHWSHVAAAGLAVGLQEVAVNAGSTTEDLVAKWVTLAGSTYESVGRLAC